MVNVLLLIGVSLLRFHPAFTNLTVIPKDTVVLVGDSTALGCNSSGMTFTWKHTSLRGTSTDPTHFYFNEKIISAYEKRGFRIVANQELGERNLAIEKVTADLAGIYECADAGDEDRRSAADLIVLEKPPECNATVNEFIGPNDCNNFSYEILLSCSVTYRGNKSPDLVWRKSGESTDLNSTCTTLNDSERICNVTVQPALDMDGSSFVCQTTERAAEEQYSCNLTTQPITTLHSFSGKESEQTTVSKGDEVVCNPISSFSCTYKWVWYEKVDDDLSRTIESTNNTLITKKIGLHRCEAQCKLRNQTCRIFPRYIEVIESQRNRTNNKNPSALIQQLPEKETQQSLWTPPVICLLILGVLHYVSFGCYVFILMRRKRTLARDHIPASEL